MEAVTVDIAIIGAGIIGLCTAWEALKRNPASTIVLLEQACFVGEHTSGRNSGVLHAGIYYPTGSLKHQLCLAGNAYWTEICDQMRIPSRRCGKFIVALDDGDLDSLTTYFDQAEKNKIPGIRWVKPSEKKKLNAITNIRQAFFSPTTGIMDVSTALQVFRDKVEALGAVLLLNHQVDIILSDRQKGFLIKTQTEQLYAGKLINCAGLGAVKLRGQLGLTDLADDWVKGCYLKTTQKLFNDQLIYPVPSPGLIGLGVHSSFDIHGDTRFGPNHQPVDSIDYQVSGATLKEMIPAIQKLFKHVDLSALHLDFAGIRPKVKHRGQLEKDFWIKSHSINGMIYIELCGMESPGLTAAPAIAKHVVDLL